MGDIAACDLCESFIEEFGKEIVEKSRPRGPLYDAYFSFYLDVNELDYSVRLYATIKDPQGDEDTVCFETVYFWQSGCAEDVAESMICLYPEENQIDELYESILSRLKEKVYKDN